LKASKYDVKFKRGETQDLGEGTGLLRQFMEDLVEELKKNEELIPVNKENAEFFIPSEKISDDNLRAVGVVMAIALATKNHIPIRFTRCFTKLLLQRDIKFYDIAFDDAELFENMRKAMTELPDSIGYCSEEEVYEQCQGRFEALRPKADLLRSSLLEFIPESILKPLTAESFCLLLSGVKKIDVARLKKDIKFTTPRNDVLKAEEKPIIGWFWEILEDELTESEMHFLLFFWTGSSMMPLQWLPPPKVQIEPIDVAKLPSAQTCTNLLRLPDYESKEALLKKLRLAIANCRTFGII